MPSKYSDMTKKIRIKIGPDSTRPDPRLKPISMTRPDPRVDPTHGQLCAECHAARVKTRKLEKAYRHQTSTESRTSWREQFINQRILYQRKFVSYWSAAISSCQGDFRAPWSKLRPLLHSGSNATSQLTADEYAQFFITKIERIRASTATAPSPIIEDRHIPEPLLAFEPATAEEILKILNRSTVK